MHFLLIGSVWFWVILAIAFVLMITATEKGSGMGATATFVLTVAILWIFGNGSSFGSLFSYGVAHPWSTLSVLLAYFIIGTCWAIMKWYFFLIDERDKAREQNSHFVSAPNVSSHKGEITLWMSYWPFSAVWTLIN